MCKIKDLFKFIKELNDINNLIHIEIQPSRGISVFKDEEFEDNYTGEWHKNVVCDVAGDDIKIIQDYDKEYIVTNLYYAITSYVTEQFINDIKLYICNLDKLDFLKIKNTLLNYYRDNYLINDDEFKNFKAMYKLE